MAGQVKWVVDALHPTGGAVPLTPAEQTQYDADQIAGSALSAATASAAANAATITAAITARLAQVRTARTAIAGGTLFASLTVNERAVIDGLLQNDIYLARICLDLYDATT